MDLRKVILQEHSKAQALKIVSYIGSDAPRFKKLIEIFLAGPYRLTQRAAWPLSLCVEKHPALIVPHLKAILDYLQTPGIHDSVKRNVMRLLQFIEIPKRFHGQVTQTAFSFLQNKKEPVAIRVFAMTVLASVCKDQPDLKRELKILVEDQLPYASAAFISRAKKILKDK
jgi:hypothetical protein